MIKRQYLPATGFMMSLLAILALSIIVTNQLAFLDDPEVVAFALTIDLTIMIPVLYYVILVRGRKWHPLSVAPVYLLSLFLASRILPGDQQQMLHLMKLLAVPVELLLIGFIVRKTLGTIQGFRAGADRRTTGADFLTSLRVSLRRSIGNRVAADILAFEVAVIYYALFSWRNGRAAKISGSFSYHRKNGYGVLLAGIIMVIVTEMIGLHLLLGLWSTTAAWLLTGLSGYGIIWLIADYRAMQLRPVTFAPDKLMVRCGLRWTIEIPYSDIRSVEPYRSTNVKKDDPSYLNMAVIGNPRIVLHLNRSVVAESIYGWQKRAAAIGIIVDDENGFIEACKKLELTDREEE